MDKNIVDNDFLNWKSDKQVLLDIKEGNLKLFLCSLIIFKFFIITLLFI